MSPSDHQTARHTEVVVLHSFWCWSCRQADSEAELEQLRIQFDNSEAARQDLEKRVKEAGIIKQRLLMACSVG